MPRVDVPGMGIVEFPDGMSDEQMASAIQKNMSAAAPKDTGEGSAKAFISGAGSGALSLLDVPMVATGAGKAAKAAGIDVPAIAQQQVEKLTGPFYQPQTTQEKFLHTAGSLAPGALAGPGGVTRKIVQGILAPAAGSEFAGEAFSDSKYAPIARVLGALGGSGAARVGEAAISPLVSNVRARMNPAGYAGGQVGRMVDESQLEPAAIAAAVGGAAGEGQPMFTVADAMGRAGQRGLSTVARAPGEGRTEVVNFLEGRQGGQGRRVANALAEGFDAPETAAQTSTRLTTARDTAADAAYGAVRRDANPVDLTSAIARIDQTLGPNWARRTSNIADDSAESALANFRQRMTDDRSMLTDFPAVQRVRGDLSDAIETARRAGNGNRARLLGQVLREMDTAMENASAGHRAANRAFAEGSRTIEAVDEGRTAAQRGRSEDVTVNFTGRPPAQQAAFRTGYVDPLIEGAQGAAFGANKARPLTSDAFQAEAGAMAPGAPLMGRRLERENTMFETRRQATGGSQTADNLADAAGAGLNPTLVAHALMGNVGAVARHALTAATNAMTGNTPQVRSEIARLLLMRGENATPAQVQNVLHELRAAEIRRQVANRLGMFVPAGMVAGQEASHAP